MLKLWKNCDVYAPAHLGRRDILMEGGVIAAVEPDLSRWESAPEIEIRDLAGAVVCPGLIDIMSMSPGAAGNRDPRPARRSSSSPISPETASPLCWGCWGPTA